MKAKFIEGADLELGLEFTAETDEERLLLRVFAHQVGYEKKLQVQGWGMGGDAQLGLRHVRIYQERK